MLKNFLERFNARNTHIIFFICIVVAFISNLVRFPHANLEDQIELLGTLVQIALPCYVIVPVLFKKDLEGAKKMVIFLTAVLVVTYILKYTIPSKRPYGGSMSFPSGHTAGAFSGAVFLARRYGLKYALVAVPLAIFVAFSRVYSRNHWPIDVFASVLICVALGILLVRKIQTN